MASVIREETNEFIGFLTDLYGPLPGDTAVLPFPAWRHSNGTLSGEFEEPIVRNGRLSAPPHETLWLKVKNVNEADLHVIVPDKYLSYIEKLAGFRKLPQFS